MEILKVFMHKREWSYCLPKPRAREGPTSQVEIKIIELQAEEGSVDSKILSSGKNYL